MLRSFQFSVFVCVWMVCVCLLIGACVVMLRTFSLRYLCVGGVYLSLCLYVLVLCRFYFRFLCILYVSIVLCVLAVLRRVCFQLCCVVCGVWCVSFVLCVCCCVA